MPFATLAFAVLPPLFLCQPINHSIRTLLLLVRSQHATLPFLDTFLPTTHMTSGAPCEPRRGTVAPTPRSLSVTPPFPILLLLCRLSPCRPSRRPLHGARAPLPLLLAQRLISVPSLRSARGTAILHSSTSVRDFRRHGQASPQRSVCRVTYPDDGVLGKNSDLIFPKIQSSDVITR